MKLLDNLEIVRGKDVEVELHLFDQFGNPEDIAGANVEFQVHEDVTLGTPVLLIVATVEPGGAKGVVRAGMNSSQTAALDKDSYVVRAIVTLGGSDHASSLHYMTVQP